MALSMLYCSSQRRVDSSTNTASPSELLRGVGPPLVPKSAVSMFACEFYDGGESSSQFENRCDTCTTAEKYL